MKKGILYFFYIQQKHVIKKKKYYIMAVQYMCQENIDSEIPNSSCVVVVIVVDIGCCQIYFSFLSRRVEVCLQIST